MLNLKRLPVLVPLLTLLSLSSTSGVALEEDQDIHVRFALNGVLLPEDYNHHEEPEPQRHHHPRPFHQDDSSTSNSLRLSKDFALRFDEELGRGDGGVDLAKLVELDNNLLHMAEMLHILPPGVVPQTTESDLLQQHLSNTATSTDTANEEGRKKATSHPDHDLPSGNNNRQAKPNSDNNEGVKSKAEDIKKAHPNHLHQLHRRQFSPKFPKAILP